MLIWRGLGIAVPILFFIAAWITSYWFDGPKSLANYPFIGWSMLWSGIVILIFGGLMAAGNAAEAEEGKPVGKNDFFWIPIWIWGIIFIGLSIWLINKEPTYYGYKAPGSSTETETVDEPSFLPGNRMVNLYNPLADTTTIKLVNPETGKVKMSSVIPPLHIRYSELIAGPVQAIYLDENREFLLDGAELKGDNAYDEAWYVLGEGVDLILLNVTAACRKDINKGELREVDWMKKMVKRYPGNTIIQPKFKLKKEASKLTMFRPGISLPTKLEENEVAYALIPIISGEELTEEYLDDMVIDICY